MPHSDPTESGGDHLTEVLVAVGNHDRAAFARLYDLTAPKLFGVCLRICGERQAAEDVLQEVYLTVWRRAGSYDRLRAPPIAWLGTIARNRAIDWRRSHTNARAVTLDDVPEPSDPADSAETSLLHGEAYHRLRHCLATLDEHQRTLILDAFFGGLTYAELATRRNSPLGTVKSWVRRGLLRLRTCLDDRA